MQRLIFYLSRYRGYFLAGCVLVILKNLFQSLSPQMVKIAVDALQGLSPAGWLYHYWVDPLMSLFSISMVSAGIVGFLIFELLHGVFLFGMRQTIIVASRKIEYDFRQDFFQHLQKLHLQFYHYTRTGDLVSRASNDLANVREVFGPGIMYTANLLVSFSLVIPMMISIDPLLTAVVFLPLLLLSYAVHRLAMPMHHRAQEVQEKLSDISAFAQESFSGIRIIKAFVLEPIREATIQRLSREYIHVNLAMVRIRGMMMAGVLLTVGLSFAVLLGYGGWRVMLKVISLGDFTAFTFYLSMLIWPMFALGWVINIFQRGKASARRMEEVFNTTPAVRDNEKSLLSFPIRGKIEFRNLCFAYRDQPVLNNIDLLIEAGKIIGFAGETGAGKSTLVQLIPRLYKVPEGALFLDDVEIHHLPLATLRESIGMVPQDPFLFSDTIRNNLLFGKPDASEEELHQAASIAQLHQTIMEFSHQYDTLIGERGVVLSGGQKQRLALARVILRKPRILILDDAFSAVDTQTEEAILASLRPVMKERTTIIVSHRIRTLQYADHIVWLSGGQITESGTHDQLIARNGAYARVFRLQQLEEEIIRI